jgi:hypothetical protein
MLHHFCQHLKDLRIRVSTSVPFLRVFLASFYPLLWRGLTSATIGGVFTNPTTIFGLELALYCEPSYSVCSSKLNFMSNTGQYSCVSSFFARGVSMWNLYCTSLATVLNHYQGPIISPQDETSRRRSQRSSQPRYSFRERGM